MSVALVCSKCKTFETNPVRKDCACRSLYLMQYFRNYLLSKAINKEIRSAILCISTIKIVLGASLSVRQHTILIMCKNIITTCKKIFDIEIKMLYTVYRRVYLLRIGVKNMYYQEKKTIASIFSGILILAAYSIYGISKYQEIGESLLSDLKFWATAILSVIVGGIIVVVIIQIIFHIILAVTNEVAKEVSKKASNEGKNTACEELEISEVEDEMDKLIALKAMRNSYIVVGVGFVIALLSLYMKMPPAIMLNIIFASFSIGSLFEGFSQLYFYRRGVKNG